MKFIEDNLISVGNTLFELDVSKSIRSRKSTEDRFILMKTPNLVKVITNRLLHQSPKVLIEFGIQRGGSVAFFNELFQPKLHIAIELYKEPVEALEAMKDRVAHDGRRLELHYGVNQGDRDALKSIISTAFAASGVGRADLVIDDASHLYEPSLASFETTFPILKQGGQYVLEDWGWAHWPGFQAENGPYAGLPALTNLVFQMNMLCAGRSDLLPELIINPGLVFARRGVVDIDIENFNLEKIIKLRDKNFNLI